MADNKKQNWYVYATRELIYERTIQVFQDNTWGGFFVLLTFQ